MKSTTDWFSPNTGATNSSGFSGLSSGGRDYSGSFGNRGTLGAWWSSGEYDLLSALNRYLYNDNTNVIKYANSKNSGLPVRIIKD